MREQRRYERFTKQIRVTWKSEELTVESITRDMCEGGAFIITPQVVPVKSIVTLEFLRDHDAPPHPLQSESRLGQQGTTGDVSARLQC